MSDKGKKVLIHIILPLCIGIAVAIVLDVCFDLTIISLFRNIFS